MQLEDLPQATLAQRSDLLPALARGTGAGGITGVLAGLVAMAFPPAGLTIAGSAVVLMALASAGLRSLNRDDDLRRCAQYAPETI